MPKIPDPARAGDYVSAEFLNFCRYWAAAQNTLQDGFQDNGTHNIIKKNTKCKFEAYAAEVVPQYAVFGLDFYHAGYGLSIVKTTETEGPGLYTNGASGVTADSHIFPTYMNPTKLYRLVVDATNSPAAGDFCQPKDWAVEKGGKNFICVEAADAEGIGLFLPLPAVGGGSSISICFVVDNDIAPMAYGLVEYYDEGYIPSGETVTVLNTHNVAFLKENTDAGQEHPADKVLVFTADRWSDPVIFPFMLSECKDIEEEESTYTPIDV